MMQAAGHLKSLAGMLLQGAINFAAEDAAVIETILCNYARSSQETPP